MGLFGCGVQCVWTYGEGRPWMIRAASCHVLCFCPAHASEPVRPAWDGPVARQRATHTWPGPQTHLHLVYFHVTAFSELPHACILSANFSLELAFLFDRWMMVLVQLSSPLLDVPGNLNLTPTTISHAICTSRSFDETRFRRNHTRSRWLIRTGRLSYSGWFILLRAANQNNAHMRILQVLISQRED